MLKNSLGICIQIVLMLRCLFLHGGCLPSGVGPVWANVGVAYMFNSYQTFGVKQMRKNGFVRYSTTSYPYQFTHGDYIGVPKVSPSAPQQLLV